MTHESSNHHFTCLLATYQMTHESSKHQKMEVRIESSKLIKPLYEGIPPSTTDYIPLTVFDKVTYDEHIPLIYAYHPPNPPNVFIETGLRKALSVYREWAGRLIKDEDDEPIILLNDGGVKFIEASADIKLDEVMLPKPTEFCLSLHPRMEGIEELAQVQITRFACGSVVVGWLGHHWVTDAHAASNFLVAWGQACRGLEIHALPPNDRGIFKPRDPPCIEYQHRGVELKNQILEKLEILHPPQSYHELVKGTSLDRFHFSLDFLAALKSEASSMNSNNMRPYSTFESLVAHLWIAATRARGVSAHEKTKLKIPVDGRMKMNPRVPDEYSGNLVLWACAATKAKDLLREPLPYAAKLIRDAVAKVNDNYFRSFLDFASHKVKEENLVPTADIYQVVEWPDMEVTSWLKFPFRDLDFVGGPSYVFMPSYFPADGTITLAPSIIGDGSLDAFVSLSEDHLATFKRIWYDLGECADVVWV